LNEHVFLEFLNQRFLNLNELYLLNEIACGME
jgi:hypothetical protein